MSLPDFMRVEKLGGPHRRTLGLRQTEQFLLLATYHLWREDAPAVDGEALDRLRGALSPHAGRERNRQFSHNVLAMALDRLLTAGLVLQHAHTLAPTARAVDELERAMAATGTAPEAMLRRLLED